MLACHPEKFKLYGQVGIGKIDHGRWGRPEDITWKRPAFFIGMDLYLRMWQDKGDKTVLRVEFDCPSLETFVQIFI